MLNNILIATGRGARRWSLWDQETCWSSQCKYHGVIPLGIVTESLHTVQVFLGLGDSLAEDAEWIDLTYNDHNTGKKFNRGSLAVSVSIVPESEAKSRPVGTGRDEPNVNPYLPPPFGRFAFSFFNPLSMISGICGTQVSRHVCRPVHMPLFYS